MRILPLALGLSALATVAAAGPFPVVVDPVKGGPIVIADGPVYALDLIDPRFELGVVTPAAPVEAGPVTPVAEATLGASAPQLTHGPVIQVTPAAFQNLSPAGADRVLTRLGSLKERAPVGSPQAADILTLAQAVITALPLDQQDAALARFGLKN
jgi:hypothetical protein